ncbi:MAG: hypothetical protein M1831_003499 [Alyxoria varia]|nr:MAG: hypothetical protein M1831_003499 [Alyxoria varia]
MDRSMGDTEKQANESKRDDSTVPPRTDDESRTGPGLAKQRDIERSPSRHSDERQSGTGRFAKHFAKFRLLWHLVIFLCFTAWWIASLVLHRDDKNWVIPFLLWGAITLRLVFFHVSVKVVTMPIQWVWQNTAQRVNNSIPEKYRVPLGVLWSLQSSSLESSDNTRANRAVSLFGLVVFMFLFWVTSRDRKSINWHTVIVGVLAQWIVSIFVLRTKAGFDIFDFISTLARELLGFAVNDGLVFLTDNSVSKLSWFLISVVPAVIFFVSFISILLYWRVLQWVIRKFALVFFWAMRVSGAEAVAAAAAPFIGQGESAILIKPFVPYLTKAEIHQVMTSGFATISGSVLGAYIGIGINGSALISSCVMSIPASLALSKIRWPETEETLTAGQVVVPDQEEDRASNVLHAFAQGAWLGIKIAGMIVATLLCIIALVGLINGLLSWWGRYINITDPPLTLELALGYICYPVAFLLGVPRTRDLYLVGQLIGVKFIENEFVAYSKLQGDAAYAELSPRSRLVATYALCSFANIGSLGTQISFSYIDATLAPSALITGAVATLTSASIAGMLVTDQGAYYTPSLVSSSS